MATKVGNIETLTQRQKEILRLISQHLQAKEVARILDISERTVKTHTEEARRRLGVTSSRDAARLLAAHEASIHIGLDDRWPARPIGITPVTTTISAHEQAQLPNRTLHDHTLERSGNRLANAGGTEQTGSSQGNPERGPYAVPELQPGESRIQYDRGDRLVDRRRDDLEQRLSRLNAFQWLGLIVIVGVLSAIMVSGLIAAVIGTLEGLQVLNRQIG